MKIIRFLILVSVAFIGFGCSQPSIHNAQNASDPLDQWNEGPAKTSILTFIKTVTDEANPAFIPVPDRVAVTDMDGTFLLEKPNPVNFDVIIRMMVDQIASNPALAQKQPYKAIHEQDWAYFDTLAYDENGIFSHFDNATAGYTEDQYRDYILNIIKRSRINGLINHTTSWSMLRWCNCSGTCRKTSSRFISCQARIPSLHGPFVKNPQAYRSKMSLAQQF